MPHEQCRDRFDLCLAKEFKEPNTFGTVHYLTVLCYMLQHNAYSREGWLDARRFLTQFVCEGKSPSIIRNYNRAELDSRNRKWSITHGAKLVGVENIVWTRTVADVRLNDAETYCADVWQWAASVLLDSETLNF